MCIMFISFFFSQNAVGDIMRDTSGKFHSHFAEYSFIWQKPVQICHFGSSKAETVYIFSLAQMCKRTYACKTKFQSSSLFSINYRTK